MERNDMHGESRLLKRRSTYYFRAGIPSDLQSLYGRKEIVYSLRTKDYREAKRLVRLASVRLDEEFENIRRQRSPERPRTVSILDEETIRGLCESWRHECLATDVWSRAQGMSDAEYEVARAQRSETLSALRDILAKGRLEKIEPALQQFLNLINLDFCGPPEDLRRLAWTFLETVIETHQAIMRRDEGEVVPTPPEPRPVSIQASREIPDIGNGLSFEACFEIWKAAVRNRPIKTIKDFQSVMNDFIARAGNRVVSQYTSADAYDYEDHLRDRDGIAPETIDKKLSYLRAIYSAAKKRHKTLPENPFSKIEVSRDRIEPAERQPFEHGDLVKIFGSPIYTQGIRLLGGGGEAAVWLPLLALFTGARLEEIGQLLVADICTEHGIDYLSITDLNPEADRGQTGKHLKNAASRRKLPIHPELIRIGFMRYVGSLRKKEEVRLFPALRPDCHGKVTGNWSKWWSRFRRKVLGITSRLKPFHSFRHTFRDACRDAGLGEEVTDALMGHTLSQKTGRRYGRGFSIAKLHEAISKINYPGLVIPVIIEDEQPD